MKILLQFQLKNNKLPIDYRRVILSFFKKALSEIADGKYYEKYYFKPERRNFSFAVNLPNPKFSKSEIALGQKCNNFSAPLGNVFILTNISQIGDKTASSSTALVKMLSPLCIREHNRGENKDSYYSVASESFEKKANKIIQEQLIESGFDDERVKSFSIQPINSKKTVVFHYGNYIECSLGEFVLNGDKAIINYLLQSGIGSRKSAGFGLPILVAE